MKRILFLSKSEMIGGLEKVLIAIVNELDKSKYDITVMTGTNNQELKKNLNENIKYRYLFNRKFKGLDRILINFNSKILHKLFINDNYDIEISFQEGYPTKIISGASKKTKKICWLHNDPNYYDFNLPFYKNKTKEKKSMENFDNIIAVSNYIADNYKKYLDLNKRIEVIYNFIDLKKIIKFSQENINDISYVNEIYRICFVGRLSEEKQVLLLIDSIESLKKRYKNIELIIVGDGHQKSYIEQIIKYKKANEYIKLLGKKENPYPYIRKSSLLVCCSKAESFCLVIGEAIALNVPVLSTRCGGPEEILENGKYGMLVENSKDGLIYGINEMINNKELYERFKNVDKKYFSKYEKKYIIKKIEDLINN